MNPEVDGKDISDRALRLRARRASTETNSSFGTPKKTTRQSKLMPITEKEPKSRKSGKKTDDDDDARSVSTERSLESMRNCKVVIEKTIEFDDDENLVSSVPKTRSRKKSALTEENLAAFSPTTARRSVRVNSTISEESTSTKPSTTLRRSTRRNSTAAPIATTTPKRELRSTRGASNSSEDLSVKSHSRRKISPSEPRTPTAVKKRGTSRLSKKLETIESVEEVLNIKKEQTFPEMSEDAEISQPQEPSVEDAYATPTGPSFSESSVICIDSDSHEENVSSTSTTAIAVDQNPSIELISTAIAVTSNELLSLVNNSNATESDSVRTKARPSISKWPKAKFRDEEEEPMDLSETINEENSSNKSGIVYDRIAEIMASAAAATAANQSVASPDIFSADVRNSETLELSETLNETVVADARKSVGVREVFTPEKIASPLKNTSQLMSATISSEQAASPKAKPRTLAKSLNIAQDEDDQNADEVAETPDSTQNSPKMSPSKLMNAIVDRIASSEELVSTRPTPVVVTDAETDKIPEPTVTSASSVNTVNDATPETSALPSDVVVSESAMENEKLPTPLEGEAYSTAHNLLAETDRWINDFVEKRFNSPANIVDTPAEMTTVQWSPVVTQKSTVEMRTSQTPNNAAAEKTAVGTPELATPVVTPKPRVEVRSSQTPNIAAAEKTAVGTPELSTPVVTPKPIAAEKTAVGTPESLTPVVTPKPIVEARTTRTPKDAVEECVPQSPKEVRAVENATQTPKAFTDVRAVQTPKTVVEEHATQTPKSITQTRAVQTPTTNAEAGRTSNVSTPRQDFDQSQKRRDTPYPDKNAQHSATDSSEIAASETAAAKDLEEHLKGSREKLKKLSTSWTHSIKRNSIDAPYIDGLGVKNKSLTGAVDEASPKKFIAARNRLEDSDDSDHRHDGEDEDEVEKPKNEFVVDEAGEATDGYESGDSMNSEERLEIEENEVIEEGISLGSEDTGSDDDDDDEMNSFIASDDDVDGAPSGSDEDEFDRLVAKPKYKRLVLQMSSDSDDDDEAVGVKNKSLADANSTASKKTAADVIEETTTTMIIQIDNSTTQTTRRSVRIECTNAPNDGFVVPEKSEQNSIVGESDNKAVNKSGFEETDRSSPEGAANNSMTSSKKRKVNASMSFMEEDAADENVETVNQSIGKVAAEFVESENAPTPEKASEPTKETEMDEQDLSDGAEESDEDDAEFHYSLNKSHPKIAEIIASAFTSGLDSLLGDMADATSSDEEEVPAPSDKTVKRSVSVDVLPSSDCEDDKIFYTFNKTHPTNETLLRLKSHNLDANKPQAVQEEPNVPMVLNSSTENSARANKPAEKFLTPRQGKENLSANQLSETVKTAAVNRSLQGDENTSAILALKPFLKKSANRSFGDIDTNQTLQVNPLSTHFDANASNLRRSSTPNQKALLKTQTVSASSKAADSIKNANNASNESVRVESTAIAKNSGKNVQSAVIESKSSPEANNNEKKSDKNSLTEETLKPITLKAIMQRCDDELLESKEKKRKQKSENNEDDERQLEKKEKNKLKKAEKLAARAAAEEKKLQQSEDARNATVERKKQKQAKSSPMQDGQQPSTSQASISAQSTSNGKRLKKKRDESSECIETPITEQQPKAKKMKRLKILTSNGEFNVSPMTPPRPQFGFIETPLTLTPRGFKVQPNSGNRGQSPKPLKVKKRRRIFDSEEPTTLLRKPQWHVESLFDGFEQTHGKKRQRESSEIHIFNSGPTQFIVKSLVTNKRRKQPASSMIPAELMDYRKQNLYRKGVPRQDARTLLKHKEKIAMSKLL